MSTGNEDRLDLLRDTLAQVLRAVSETGFEERKPRLRDRNGFVNALMHGERDTLEKVRPRWREYRRNVERAKELTSRIESIVHDEVAAEPEYRALGAAAAREARARRSCGQLLDAVAAARARVTRAATSATDDAERATVRREFEEVSRLLDRVRRHADDLRADLTSWSAPRELSRLRLEYSRGDDPRRRGRKLDEVDGMLHTLEHAVGVLLGEVAAREAGWRAKQARYMAEGRARHLG